MEDRIISLTNGVGSTGETCLKNEPLSSLMGVPDVSHLHLESGLRCHLLLLTPGASPELSLGINFAS
jgi:hypothetical protein